MTSDAKESRSLRDLLRLDFDLADVLRAAADEHPRAAALYARIINEAIAVFLLRNAIAQSDDPSEAVSRRGSPVDQWDFKDVLKDLVAARGTHAYPDATMRRLANQANQAVHFPWIWNPHHLQGVLSDLLEVLVWLEDTHGPLADNLQGLADVLHDASGRPSFVAPTVTSEDFSDSVSPVVPLRSHGFIRCGAGLHLVVPSEFGVIFRPMGPRGSLPMAVTDPADGFVLTGDGGLAVTLSSGCAQLEAVGVDANGRNPVMVAQREEGAPTGTVLLAASRLGRLAARCLVADGTAVHLWDVTARKAPSVRQVGDGDVTLGVIVDEDTVWTAEGDDGIAGRDLRGLFPELDRLLSIDRVPARLHGMVAVLGTDRSGQLRAQVRDEDRALALDEAVDPRATQVAIARDLGRRYASALVAVSTITDVEIFELEARP